MARSLNLIVKSTWVTVVISLLPHGTVKNSVKNEARPGIIMKCHPFLRPTLEWAARLHCLMSFQTGPGIIGNIFEAVKDLLNYDVFLLNNLVKWQHWWQHSLGFYNLLHSTCYRTSTECLPSLNCQAFLLFPFNNYKQTTKQQQASKTWKLYNIQTKKIHRQNTFNKRK